jgi:hypothetical protein
MVSEWVLLQRIFIVLLIISVNIITFFMVTLRPQIIILPILLSRILFVLATFVPEFKRPPIPETQTAFILPQAKLRILRCFLDLHRSITI